MRYDTETMSLEELVRCAKILGAESEMERCIRVIENAYVFGKLPLCRCEELVKEIRNGK